jgi:hypothetical protein
MLSSEHYVLLNIIEYANLRLLMGYGVSLWKIVRAPEMLRVLSYSFARVNLRSLFYGQMKILKDWRRQPEGWG